MCRAMRWSALVWLALTLVVTRLAVAQHGPAEPSHALTAGAVADGAVRLDDGRFTVLTYPADLALARHLLSAAATQDSFPGLPRPVAHVIIAVAPDLARFRDWTGPATPEWGAAIAIPARQRIVVRGRGANATAGGDPVVVLRHELAHLALHEALGDLPPRWFDEGYASYAASEWGREEILATNYALLFRRLPSLRALDARLTGGAGEARDAYALAYRAVAELAALDPDRGLTMLVRHWRESGRLDSAVRRAYGITLDGFEQRWQQRTRLRYGMLALVGDLTVATLFSLAVMVPLVMARRRRDRSRMQRLRRVDALLDARATAMGTTVDVLLGLESPPSPAGAVRGSGPDETAASLGDGASSCAADTIGRTAPPAMVSEAAGPGVGEEDRPAVAEPLREDDGVPATGTDGGTASAREFGS